MKAKLHKYSGVTINTICKKLIYPILILALFSQQVKAQESSSESSAEITKGIISAAVLGGVIIGGIIYFKVQKNKKKKLERANTLEGKKVQSLAISYAGDNNGQTFGSIFNMIIKAGLDNGKELTTIGAGNGLTSWSDYLIEVEGGTFENGVLTISRDMKAIPNNKVTLKASVKSDPSVSQSLQIPLLFDADLLANFQGFCGRNGKSGYDGDGMKSVGDGERGNDGGDADDGEEGGDGQEVEVFVKAAMDANLNKEMLYVKVKSLNTDKQGFYIVDPTKAKITVSANGGCGGDGGRGGRGGKGGGGAYGGRGGNGGKGGNGSNGGNGGKIKVYMDPSAKKYESAIILTNVGGSGGSYGSGGAVGSGGSGNTKSGDQGNYGKDGSRSGRGGSNGPAPVIETQSVNIEF